MKNIPLLLLISLFSLLSCSTKNSSPEQEEPPVQQTPSFYFGADLSYVNEMLDCGATYKDESNTVKNPYTIFKEAGTNLVRLRLWHNPDWTDYSNYEDVKNAIQTSKALGMKVLLDFHYSDDWADPSKQKIPKAWEDQINNKEALGELLYDYTYNTLTDLSKEDLLPEMVQVGNEINAMILQGDTLEWPIDWERNSYLINKGIKAVRDVSNENEIDIELMLHIAQPENGLWWFKDATEHGIVDYDWIGLSYYPLWSEYTLDNVGAAFQTLINTYNKKLMVVETAYPFTMDNVDDANNILTNDSLISGYPATEKGQLDYLLKLKEVVENSGGQGVVYWEPAWVSTNCKTRWGTGSHWDNATFFDRNHKAHLGMQFFNGSKN